MTSEAIRSSTSSTSSTSASTTTAKATTGSSKMAATKNAFQLAKAALYERVMVLNIHNNNNNKHGEEEVEEEEKQAHCVEEEQDDHEDDQEKDAKEVEIEFHISPKRRSKQRKKDNRVMAITSMASNAMSKLSSPQSSSSSSSSPQKTTTTTTPTKKLLSTSAPSTPSGGESETKWTVPNVLRWHAEYAEGTWKERWKALRHAEARLQLARDDRDRARRALRHYLETAEVEECEEVKNAEEKEKKNDDDDDDNDGGDNPKEEEAEEEAMENGKEGDAKLPNERYDEMAKMAKSMGSKIEVAELIHHHYDCAAGAYEEMKIVVLHAKKQAERAHLVWEEAKRREAKAKAMSAMVETPVEQLSNTH